MTPPVFAHGHLRLYLLTLLAERPMHGYELIQALGDRFGGTYVPSAGTIYPRLSKLEEEGLVDKEADGRKTVYAITDAGRAELTARGPEVERLESELSDSVRRLADEVRVSVEGAMRSLKADLAAAARDARDEARASGRRSDAQTDRRESWTGVPDDRGASRTRLREAELAIGEFRSALRAEIARGAARGAVSERTVAVLREGLARTRAEVLAALAADRIADTGEESGQTGTGERL